MMRFGQQEPAEPRVTERIILRAGLTSLLEPSAFAWRGAGAGQRLDPLLRGEVMEA